MQRIVVFMIISALSFTLLNVLVKSLNHFNVYQIVFFRSIGSLLFTFPLLLKSKINILGNKRTLLFTRAVFGFTAMTLFFSSLKYLTTGSAVAIRYIAPIFATIFATFMLKENIKKQQWLYFGIAFSGILILKGFDANVGNIGLLYVTISAVLTGIVFILIRKIGNEDHPLVIVNYFMCISAILGGFLMYQHWVTPKNIEWILLLGLGVFGYYGQYYMTKAFQKSEINKVAPLKYIEAIFTILIGSIWLDEIYTLYSLLGILLILTGLTLNTLLIKK